MLSTLGLLVAFSANAEARDGRHGAHPAPHHGRVVVAPHGHTHFTIGIGPWSPAYRPAPRVGFRWITGYYVRGTWWPGYWEPVAPPPTPGLVWVPGHWDGGVYVDGYWRDAGRPGMTWVEGYYDDDGNWIDGRWVDSRDAEAYRQGPTASFSTSREEAPPSRYEAPAESSETGPAAIPLDVQEDDPSDVDEIHAPPPDRQ
jgi:hypothetical protein